MPKIISTVSVDMELYQFMTRKGIKLSGLVNDTLGRIREQEKNQTVERESNSAHLDSALRFIESRGEIDIYEAWKTEQTKKEETEPAVVESEEN